MGNWSIKASVVLVGSLAYWYAASLATGRSEPWDTGAYWVAWYPMSLALSALGGYFLRARGGVAGVIVTFAQFPVMAMINGELGSLFALGLFLLGILAIPAALIAQAAGRVRSRP